MFIMGIKTIVFIPTLATIKNKQICSVKPMKLQGNILYL